jgi:ABC-type sulfate transport system substrate-binding protein
MAQLKTLPTDEVLIYDQRTGPSPRNPGDIVHTLKTFNLRNGQIRTLYVVEGYRNRPNWSQVLADPSLAWIVKNLKDEGLNNIDADSEVDILQSVTAQEVIDIKNYVAKNLPSALVSVQEPKSRRKDKPGNEFNKLFKVIE